MNNKNNNQPANNSSYSKPIEALSLYLVTDHHLCQQHGLIDTVCQAIEGGVSFVQLRDKVSDDHSVYKIACELKEAIAGSVPLVMNDRVLIAKKAGLDGAHIGQNDLDVDQARDILGPDAWLGLSINTLEQLRHAHAHHVTKLDYFGFGPVFSTNTKSDHAPPIGIEGLSRLVKASHLPAVGIGGINISNASDVYRTQCNGIAVVSAICAATDPRKISEQLLMQKLGDK